MSEATLGMPLSEIVGIQGLSVAGRGFCSPVMDMMGYDSSHRELAVNAAPAPAPEMELAAKAQNFMNDFKPV
jgi:hypothetical protein